MSLVKSGQIANCCHPNALMTLKEYLEDYASPDTREKGLKVIEKELQKVEREKQERSAQGISKRLNREKEISVSKVKSKKACIIHPEWGIMVVCYKGGKFL